VSTPEEQYYPLGANVSFVIGLKIVGWLLLALGGVLPLIGATLSFLPGAKPVSIALKVRGFLYSLFNIGMSIAILFFLSRPEPLIRF
jgi:hypothetical protein